MDVGTMPFGAYPMGLLLSICYAWVTLERNRVLSISNHAYANLPNYQITKTSVCLTILALKSNKTFYTQSDVSEDSTLLQIFHLFYKNFNGLIHHMWPASTFMEFKNFE